MLGTLLEKTSIMGLTQNCLSQLFDQIEGLWFQDIPEGKRTEILRQPGRFLKILPRE